MSRSRGRHVVDHAIADRDRAGRELLETGDHPERGGLAAARRSDEDHELPVGDLERQVVHGDHVAGELLGHVVERRAPAMPQPFSPEVAIPRMK